MTATCPVCGREGCKVQEDFMQATRMEPRKPLGSSGWCPDCQVSFKVNAVQLRLEAS